VLVAINPNRQIEAARQAKRRTDINTITKAIQQYSIDNNGQYPVGIETGAKAICQTGNTPTGCIDLSTFLVPDYLAAIPEADSTRYYVRKNISGTSIEVTHPKDNLWNIGGTPSLDLNFAKNKSLIDSVSGNNLITFTRNSPATYVGEDGLIKIAAANEPRFDHDPVTGESLGLLIEEQRENLLTWSQDFIQWSKTGSSITSNSIISPSGMNNANLLTEDTSNGGHQVSNNASITNNTPVTLYVYAKSKERFKLKIAHLTANFSNTTTEGFFDLSNGTILAQRNLNSAFIKNVGNGWYLCSITATPTTTTTSPIFIASLNDNGNAFYQGDGTSGIYIWGAQLERSKDPSSYIPTLDSTVIRSSDNVFVEGDKFENFFNPNEGTALITYRPRFNGVYNSPFRPLYAIRNSLGNIMGFSGNSNNGQLYFHSYTSLLEGGNFTWLYPPSPSLDRSESIVLSYTNTYFRMYENERPFASTNTTYGAGKIEDFIPSSVGISNLGFNTLVFGGSSVSNELTKFNHILQRFVYYPIEVGISNAKTLSKTP
jgi:hypothetical protein